MKNNHRLIAIYCCFIMILNNSILVTGGDGYASFSVENSITVSPQQGTNYEGVVNYSYLKGRVITIDFNLESNSAINSGNMLVEYNPEVIQPVRMNDITDKENFVINGNNDIFFTSDYINERIDYIAENETVTSGKLGKIYLENNFNGNPLNKGTGTLFRMKFRIMGEGNTEIEINDLSLKDNENNEILLTVNSPKIVIGTYIPDTVVTDSAITDSVITDSVITDSVITDSVITDSVITDDVVTEPTIDNLETWVDVGTKISVMPQGGTHYGNVVNYKYIRGRVITVDFYIENNPGINNGTLLVEYNPDIISPIVMNGIKQEELDDFVTYKKTGDEMKSVFFSPSYINQRLNYIPDKTDSDFKDIADGFTTSANLGRIYLTDVIDEYLSESNTLLECYGDGIFFRMKFVVKSEGETELKIRQESLNIQRSPVVDRDKEAIIARKIKTELQSAKILIGDYEDYSPIETTETTTHKIDTEEVTRESLYEGKYFPEGVPGIVAIAKDYQIVDGVVSYKFIKDNTFDVYFCIENNPGINCATFFVNFDPNVVQPVPVDFETQENIKKYFVNRYDEDYDMYLQLIGRQTINNQISMKPGINDDNYLDVAPDGVKTSAELGRVKLSANIDKYIPEEQKLEEVKGDGAIFKMTFKMINEGSTEIYISTVGDSFMRSPYVDDDGYIKSNPFEVSFVPVYISLDKDVVVPEKPVEPKEYLYGDMDYSGVVDSGDATIIFYHVCNKVKNPLTEEQKILADVDFNGIIDASDAATVFYHIGNKVINPLEKPTYNE